MATISKLKLKNEKTWTYNPIDLLKITRFVDSKLKTKN